MGRVLSLSLSDLNPLRGEEAYLCADIGSASVKILEVCGKGSKLRVSGFGAMPTPTGAVQSNMVYDPGAVGEVVHALVESKKMKARKVVTAVPGPAVIIKRMTLPAQSAEEIENTILYKAGNFIPEDLENVNLDYQITDYLDDGKRVEVMLVAAKRDIVSSYADTIRAAGLSPMIVDVDYFALENMYELNYQESGDAPVALVNIGARYSCMNILRGGRSTFTGDVPVGGKEFNDALVRNLGVSAVDAETIKLGTNPAHPIDQIEPILQPVKEFLAEEIHRALSFFWTAATDEQISAILLSGGTSRVPGLVSLLSERLEVPVQVVNPLTKVRLAHDVDRAALEKDAPAFAIAVGLGVRRPGDK